eukprot:symbB.v1.2.020563.t1/scaffold1741.1/size103732/4
MISQCHGKLELTVGRQNMWKSYIGDTARSPYSPFAQSFRFCWSKYPVDVKAPEKALGEDDSVEQSVTFRLPVRKVTGDEEEEFLKEAAMSWVQTKGSSKGKGKGKKGKFDKGKDGKGKSKGKGKGKKGKGKGKDR